MGPAGLHLVSASSEDVLLSDFRLQVARLFFSLSASDGFVLTPGTRTRANAEGERRLRHRPTGAVRVVAIPPQLVAIPREHIEMFGTASDGRLLRGLPTEAINSTVCTDVPG